MDELDPSIIFRFASNIKTRKISGFKWIQLTSSINTKLLAIDLLKNEVLTQIPHWEESNQEVERVGYSSSIQSTILQIKYQTFLNGVYSLCQNLALIGAFLLPDVPQRYSKQLSKINFILEKYPEYGKILLRNDWFINVNLMRDEYIHFYDGFIFINSEKKPGILFKDMGNERKGMNQDTRIEINDITDHITEVTNGVNDYFISISRYLLNFIQDDYTIYEHCFFQLNGEKTVRVYGPKIISFRDFCDRKPWRCGKLFPCPNENNCPLEPF